MRVDDQNTVAKSVAVSGVGLHTGEAAQLVLMPAQDCFGVKFVRTDLLARGEFSVAEATIAAAPRFVRDARLGVWLENVSGVSVRTVEHLMAALSLSGVDNVLIEIDGPEVPILDGSAAAFMDLIREAGLKPLAAPRRTLVIEQPIRVESGDRYIEALPSEQARLEVTIDFEDEAIGRQSLAFSPIEDAAMIARLVSARTFCLLSEVEAMRAAGLGRGGSLDNAVVVDGGRLLNAAGLRDPNEFVLHKALDLIGDLALTGAQVKGLIRAHKPGHDLNTRLAAQILAPETAARLAAEPAASPRRARLSA
jgi:UDP-3-O-[3-hydroxymyristoyl] N-acetylglucosamine deacetylase